MKKKNNWFKRILIVLFIIFIGLYISSISGFYESNLSNKVALTEEAIEKFEEDVINGKQIDVENFIDDEYVDYSNKFSTSGDKFSEVVVKILTKGLSGAWDTIKVLFLGIRFSFIS